MVSLLGQLHDPIPHLSLLAFTRNPTLAESAVRVSDATSTGGEPWWPEDQESSKMFGFVQWGWAPKMVGPPVAVPVTPRKGLGRRPFLVNVGSRGSTALGLRSSRAVCARLSVGFSSAEFHLLVGVVEESAADESSVRAAHSGHP